jgi:uncharacterized protein
MVFVRGRAIGSEQLQVVRTATGWTLSGDGRLAPPIDVIARQVEIRYDGNWQPIEMMIQGTARGQTLVVRTTFDQGSATTRITEGGHAATRTHEVAPDAVVLPNIFFGSYAALAARLPGMSPGTELPGYIPMQSAVTLRLESVSDERITTQSRAIQARRHNIALVTPGGEIELDIWIDEQGRLLRFFAASQALEVVREDVGSVAARIETAARPGDEPVSIPAAGFNLAGTVSKPADASGRLPAVILVGGSTSSDRDETTGRVHVFADLADALADEGFLVVRYDRRGSGQSGGRAEVATIADYAEDVRSVVRYLQRRKDVDSRRLAAVGYGEGGWIAMEAASREKRIAALGLIATAGTTGAELVLEQQRAALERMDIPEAEKQAKVDLQQRIHEAVTSNTGWRGIPEAMRYQADTPWFRSLLAFDPAARMRNLRQPVLILHGELDSHVPASHADLLESMARARKRPQAAAAVHVERLSGVGHDLSAGGAGATSAATSPGIDERIGTSLVAWLQQALPPPRR